MRIGCFLRNKRRSGHLTRKNTTISSAHQHGTSQHSFGPMICQKTSTPSTGSASTRQRELASSYPLAYRNNTTKSQMFSKLHRICVLSCPPYAPVSFQSGCDSILEYFLPSPKPKNLLDLITELMLLPCVAPMQRCILKLDTLTHTVCRNGNSFDKIRNCCELFGICHQNLQVFYKNGPPVCRGEG